MNTFVFNMMNLVLAGNAGVSDEEGFKSAIDDFFTNDILAWAIWAITMLFIILVIQAGVKMAMAKTPEEKQASKSKLISIAIGLGISLSASVIVTVLSSLFNNIWN